MGSVHLNLRYFSKPKKTQTQWIWKFQNPNLEIPETSKNLKPKPKKCWESCNFMHHFSPKFVKPENGSQTQGIFTNPLNPNQKKFENLQTCLKTQTWSQWKKVKPEPKEFWTRPISFWKIKTSIFSFFGFWVIL